MADQWPAPAVEESVVISYGILTANIGNNFLISKYTEVKLRIEVIGVIISHIFPQKTGERIIQAMPFITITLLIKP
ncbi:hypothetical protein [Hallella colorans]|jgi:hypothetical protein|uniref:hypothetical protein n=1 Tax=Hallella colorans TaxID=1703337 RepID=UPI0023F1DB8B|nr:hypothetical protein [Hallella colorans]